MEGYDMTVEEQCIDWLLNVWDNLGEETTKEDIVRDFTNILGDEDKASIFVEAWFKDHGKLLQASVGVHPAMKLMAFENAIREWVQAQLDDDTPLEFFTPDDDLEGLGGDEGGEDAACGKGCGLEPMGCSRCSKVGNDTPDHPYADFDDARHW
jgi:hypothetical protein